MTDQSDQTQNASSKLRSPKCGKYDGRPLYGLEPIHDPAVYGITRAKVNKLGFRTTSNDYGKYPPTKAILPTSSHPRTNEFAANHILKPEDGRMNI